MPAWPPLPFPQYVSPEQYREMPPRAAAEIPMSAGMPKSFRTALDAGRRYSVVLELDNAQLDVFDAFWRGDLRDGEQIFDWVLPRTQTAAKFAIRDRPVYRHVSGDIYQVRFLLETRDDDREIGVRSVTRSRSTVSVVVEAVISVQSRTGSHTDLTVE